MLDCANINLLLVGRILRLPTGGWSLTHLSFFVFFPLLRVSRGGFFFKWSWFPWVCWIFYFHWLHFWRKVRKIGEKISIKPARGAAFEINCLNPPSTNLVVEPTHLQKYDPQIGSFPQISGSIFSSFWEPNWVCYSSGLPVSLRPPDKFRS